MTEVTRINGAQPHAFEAGDRNPRWCRWCGCVADVYLHAPEGERQEFDQAQAAQAADLERWRGNIAGRRAEIEERDYIVHALAEQPGFILEQITTAPAPVSFRYFRDGRNVTVTISVEQS